MEVTIKEVEIAKLSLQPGDILMAKVKGDDFEHEETMQSLQNALQTYFPNNKIMVFSMGTDHDLTFEVVRQSKSQPMSYCSDCSCGKKEAAEGECS